MWAGGAAPLLVRGRAGRTGPASTRRAGGGQPAALPSSRRSPQHALDCGGEGLSDSVVDNDARVRIRGVGDSVAHRQIADKIPHIDHIGAPRSGVRRNLIGENRRDFEIR